MLALMTVLTGLFSLLIGVGLVRKHGAAADGGGPPRGAGIRQPGTEELRSLLLGIGVALALW